MILLLLHSHTQTQNAHTHALSGATYELMQIRINWIHISATLWIPNVKTVWVFNTIASTRKLAHQAIVCIDFMEFNDVSSSYFYFAEQSMSSFKILINFGIPTLDMKKKFGQKNNVYKFGIIWSWKMLFR